MEAFYDGDVSAQFCKTFKDQAEKQTYARAWTDMMAVDTPITADLSESIAEAVRTGHVPQRAAST